MFFIIFVFLWKLIISKVPKWLTVYLLRGLRLIIEPTNMIKSVNYESFNYFVDKIIKNFRIMYPT